ncbi:MAG: tyrosine-type recombinase/integrase [Pseudohongiellaceae bacterium]
MALKKRGDTWWMDVTIAGTRYRESMKTNDHRAAKELHDIRRGDLWRQGVLKERPKKVWADAAARWLHEREHKKSIADDQGKLAALAPALGSKLLADIDRDMIESVLPTDVAPATRNRYRALIRAILRAAVREWDWITKEPCLRVEYEPRRRISYLTRPQADALISALPPHYRQAIRFALLTGLRKSNAMNLEWANVDLERSMVIVDADDAKAGERILVPLNAQARQLLAELPTRTGRVFQCPARVSPSVWKSATKKAGVECFRFHDLRHTWASWHAMAGTPLSVLQELGGWHSPQMVQRYAHLSPEHLAAAAENVNL